MTLRPTASQTVGPYFHNGLSRLNCDDIAALGVAGERFVVRGHLLDGDGRPVYDAQIEIWQADAHGQYAHPGDPQNELPEPNFKGFARICTDEQGMFQLKTIKPGPVLAPQGYCQSPHVTVLVFARGLLKYLVTRFYFPDEPGNSADPVLKLVPSERRSTLIAKGNPEDKQLLEWNIVLRGESETVFFDF